MTANGITAAQAAAIPPLNVREYARASGWERRDSRRPERVILSRTGSLDQMIFPNDPGFDDYGQVILEIIHKLSELERRPTFEVYADLLAPDADQVRAGVESPEADRGQLDFDHAVAFFDGLRQAIMSAACSVIAPRRFHPRLNRADALDLLKSAKLNHSEPSSYTVSVSLPLHGVEPGSLTEPFTRRVTSLLMRS